MRKPLLVVATALSLSLASTAFAAPPQPVDYQQRARDLASQKAAAAFVRGPEKTDMSARKSFETTKGLKHDGFEYRARFKGFFSNSAQVHRETRWMTPDGTRGGVSYTTTKQTGRTWWRWWRPKTTTTTLVSDNDGEYRLKVKDVGNRRRVNVEVTLFPPGQPAYKGDDKVARARAGGNVGGTPNLAVENRKPYVQSFWER